MGGENIKIIIVHQSYGQLNCINTCWFDVLKRQWGIEVPTFVESNEGKQSDWDATLPGGMTYVKGEYRRQNTGDRRIHVCFDSRSLPAVEMTSEGETCSLVRQSFCCCVLRGGQALQKAPSARPGLTTVEYRKTTRSKNCVKRLPAVQPIYIHCCFG